MSRVMLRARRLSIIGGSLAASIASRRGTRTPAGVEGTVSCSGIVVRIPPDRLAATLPELSALPGVRVHQQDPATGRLVLTLEAASIDDEIEGLRRIQRLPGVASAELVYHRLREDDPAPGTGVPSPSAPQQGET
jgi:nitrate reductase NapD